MILRLLTRSKQVLSAAATLIFLACFSLLFAQDIPLPENSRQASEYSSKCQSCQQGQGQDFISRAYRAELPFEEVKGYYRDKLAGYSSLNDLPLADGSQSYAWQQGNDTYNLFFGPYPGAESSTLIVFTRPEAAALAGKAGAKTEEPLKIKAPKFSAKKIGGEDFLIDGKDAKLEHFSTVYPFKKVKEYYDASLRQKDWELLMGDSGQGQAMYRKENQYVSLGKLSEATGRTDFVVTEGEFPAGTLEDDTTKRQPLKEPLFIPVEPSLKQTNYIQDKSGKNIVIIYESEKDYKELINYYMYQMPAAGWKYAQERDFAGIADKIVPPPAGDKDSQGVTDAIKRMKGKLLFFSGRKGKCSISVIGISKNISVVEVRYDTK